MEKGRRRFVDCGRVEKRRRFVEGWESGKGKEEVRRLWESGKGKEVRRWVGWPVARR